MVGTAPVEDDERFLATRPPVEVPAIVLDLPEDPGAGTRSRGEHVASFARLLDHRLVVSDHGQPCDVPAEVVSVAHGLHVLLSYPGVLRARSSPTADRSVRAGTARRSRPFDQRRTCADRTRGGVSFARCTVERQARTSRRDRGRPLH